MKKESRRWIARFLTVLMMGGLLVVGAAALDTAWAGPQIFSGLVSSKTTGTTHCSVVNTNPGPISPTITVLIEIRTGATGLLANCLGSSSVNQTIAPGDARGLTCDGVTNGVYCQVTGAPGTNGNFPAKGRATMSVRDADGTDISVQELR